MHNNIILVVGKLLAGPRLRVKITEPTKIIGVIFLLDDMHVSLWIFKVVHTPLSHTWANDDLICYWDVLLLFLLRQFLYHLYSGMKDERIVKPDFVIVTCIGIFKRDWIWIRINNTFIFVPYPISKDACMCSLFV